IVGARNGKNMFSRLAEEIEEFNINEKGCAWNCCHSLQQARELVYIDTTAGLDALNTPLTILSVKVLNILKRIMPLEAFNGRGLISGPEDGKHGISMNDHVVIIGYLEKIVFARTEIKLEEFNA
ncbi:8631_t:CDS:2, partial [Ambispora leptoticha]